MGKGEVPRGGVIRDEKVRLKVLDDIKDGVTKLGFEYLRSTLSPITGRDGNVEFFMHLRKLVPMKEGE